LRQDLVWAVGGALLVLLGAVLPKPIASTLFATGIALLALAGTRHLVLKVGDKYEVW
jgi:hypothetical protein